MLPLDEDPKSLELTITELALKKASFGQKNKILLGKIINYSTKAKVLLFTSRFFKKY